MGYAETDGVLNGKAPKGKTAKAVIGLGDEDQGKRGNHAMAANLKFSDAEQLEMLETLLAEMSDDVLYAAANAIEAKGQFVVVVNGRQCEKCHRLVLPNMIRERGCAKCQ